MKNAENKASYPYDERKTRKITLRRDTMNKETAKNSFPSRGKRRKQRKMNFSHGGKTKISRRYFLKIGKTRKCGKSDFPNLGRTKNLKDCISQPLGEQKILLGAFPTPCTSDFPIFHSSEASDGLSSLFNA